LLGWLFDATPFSPRKFCVSVNPSFQYSAMAAEILTGVAYLGIPIMLLLLVKRRPALVPSRSAIIAFVAFITFCGIGHFLDAIMWEYPMYRVWVISRWATGLVSFATLLMLPIVYRTMKKFRSSQEYHDMADIANQERMRAEVLRMRAERRVQSLETELGILRTEIHGLQWHDRTKDKAAVLLHQLDRVIEANRAGVA
jgi:hypothetical protein